MYLGSGGARRVHTAPARPSPTLNLNISRATAVSFTATPQGIVDKPQTTTPSKYITMDRVYLSASDAGRDYDGLRQGGWFILSSAPDFSQGSLRWKVTYGK